MSFVNKTAFGIVATLAVAVPAQAQAQQADCRAITDAAARLACYDAREKTPATPPSPPTAVPPPPSAAAPYAPAPSAPTSPPVSSSGAMTTAQAVKADPSGEVAVVTRLRYSMYRIQLADGRIFDTTVNNVVPPAVGDVVTLRRGAFGNTFLDIPGRDSITVRLSRSAQ